MALTSIIALAPGTFAGEPLPDRPGFGYTIHFITGISAEALLPVERQALPDRPGFGYTIKFISGDPADSLFPPGWAKQKSVAIVSHE